MAIEPRPHRSRVAGTLLSVARMHRGEQSPLSATTNLVLVSGGTWCSPSLLVKNCCKQGIVTVGELHRGQVEDTAHPAKFIVVHLCHKFDKSAAWVHTDKQ
jgi:hypothetical protein